MQALGMHTYSIYNLCTLILCSYAPHVASSCAVAPAGRRFSCCDARAVVACGEAAARAV
jgi:hypothetical protein